MADFNPGDFGDSNASRPTNGNAGNGSAPGHFPGSMHVQSQSSQHYGNQPGGPGQAHAAHSQSMMESGADGLAHILARQWYVIVLATIAALLLSILFLMLTRPSYTSIAQLRVTPIDLATISSTPTNPNLQLDSDFLETECVVIKSNAVLALAMDKIRDTRTLKGMPHPMDFLRTRLQADPSKVGKAIDVSFESHSQDDSDRIVDAVVVAYKLYEDQASKTRADDLIKTLTAASKGKAGELVDTLTQLNNLERSNGFRPDADPEKTSQHDEVMSLRDAKQKAELESLRAQTAYAQASKAIIGNETLIHAVDDAERHPTYSTSPQEDLKKYQDTLAIEQAKLMEDSRLFGPNHPTILTDQARLNDMIVRTVVAAKEWEESAQSGQEALDKSLTVAVKDEQKIADAQREYIRLREEAVRLRTMSNEVDKHVQDLNRVKIAGGVNIEVLNQDVVGDVKPAKLRTLGIGLVLGLIGGLGLSCVRDWTDDRMRTPHAVRATVGAPILGAIPAITTAYTAADRGQIVHHEPFGIAAESYRTLRTALQFGLPAGTRTLLITSPVSGDGKSTFVSNLGIAMAQASKRVLIVDADFRAPMQHRLFGLRDRAGFASVLNGVDTLEQAIQKTEVQGLDVLPCGPTPLNPAEMLNSPAFTEHLHELADRYDIILLDSPPVTAVADARILAASVDVSLMVIRLETSTRKQAEAARDGLRSVGARVVGVVVNGVTRAAGNFGGASGYYQTGTNASSSIERQTRASNFGSPALGDENLRNR